MRVRAHIYERGNVIMQPAHALARMDTHRYAYFRSSTMRMPPSTSKCARTHAPMHAPCLRWYARACTHASKHSSCACAYNRMHIGASMTIHPYACASIQMHTHAHNGPDACQHVAHACTFARLHGYPYTRVHAYTLTRIHAYTHTRLHKLY